MKLTGSDRKVEKVVKKYYYDCLKSDDPTSFDEELVSSFIVCEDDPIARHIFNEKERDEIAGKVEELCPLHTNLEQVFDAMKKLQNADGVKDMALQLLSRQGPFKIQPDNPSIREWLVAVLMAWLPKLAPHLQADDKSERWYPINFWGRISDDLMQTIPGMVMQR